MPFRLILCLPMPLHSRVAIITGAARGIGRACAEAFLRARALGVVIADIDEAPGRKTASELDPSGRRARFLPTDVTREADPAARGQETLRRYRPLDAPVNKLR